MESNPFTAYDFKLPLITIYAFSDAITNLSFLIPITTPKSDIEIKFFSQKEKKPVQDSKAIILFNLLLKIEAYEGDEFENTD